MTRIAFAESHSWEAFAAMAGALRTRGIEVVHLMPKPQGAVQRVTRAVERPLWGQPQFVLAQPGSDPAVVDESAFIEVLDSCIDLQAHDDLVLPLSQVRHELTNPGRRLGPQMPVELLVDKFVQGQVALDSGVPTPAISSDTSTTEQYPVVVKARVGFGGVGVAIAEDPIELADAVTRLDTPGSGGVFLQEFFAGDFVNCGGVAADGRVLAVGCYLPEPAPDDPKGPAYCVRPIVDEAVVTFTKQWIHAIGYTGFFSIDWVYARDGGDPQLIDFNPRIFGSWPALQQVGVPLIEAYLHVLGLGPAPDVDASYREGDLLTMLRFPFPKPADRAALSKTVAEQRAIVDERLPTLGSSWAKTSRAKIKLATAQQVPGLIR